MTKIFVAANLFVDGRPIQLPCWEHDCDQCVFLGQTPGADAWFCSEGHELIVRDGSEPQSNASFTLDMATQIAVEKPRTNAAAALRLYAEWQSTGTGDAHTCELGEPESVETIVGLYQDLKVARTERQLYVSDQHGNPLGSAVIFLDRLTRLPNRYAFHPEDNVASICRFAEHQDFMSERALWLYCMTIAQDMTDGGH
jgi:hypothetical protein